MFCNECGEKNSLDSKFCINCGTPLRHYTQPKTQLININELQLKQKKIAKLNNNIKKLNIAITLLIILAAFALTASIFFDNMIRVVMLCIASVCIATCLLLALARYIANKRKQQINK